MMSGNLTVDETSVLVREVEPPVSMSLLWLPYVLVTALMVVLLCVSFIRFHLQNKERYQKRSVVARRKNPDRHNTSLTFEMLESEHERVSPSGDDVVRSFQLVNVQPDVDRTAARASGVGRSEADVDDVIACSSTAGTSRNASTARQHHISGQAKRNIWPLNEIDPAPDGGVTEPTGLSFVERMEEQVVRAALSRRSRPKINCSQSLTFIKRDSKHRAVPTFDGAPLAEDNARWVSLKNTDRRVGHGTNRVNQVSPCAEADRRVPTSSLMSFVGSRLKQNSGRSVKINMWSNRQRPEHGTKTTTPKRDNRRF